MLDRYELNLVHLAHRGRWEILCLVVVIDDTRVWRALRNRSDRGWHVVPCDFDGLGICLVELLRVRIGLVELLGGLGLLVLVLFLY